MSIADLLIGATLMNSMPHLVLGVWKGKMLSGFGTGNLQNILWGLTNFVCSITLFIYNYGFDGLIRNGIYLGGILVLVVFFSTSFFWRRYYAK